jgi:Protein of unknown function (DUF2911)
MNTKSLVSITLGVFISCAMMIAPAKADVWNQQTKVTFSQPVEVPGRTLPAGTYWFVLANNDTDRNIVQIFSQDWSTLYATVLTVPSDRLIPPDDTLLTLAKRESNGTPALVKWFYPGETIGHEFEYSKSEESELAQDRQETLLVNPQGSTVINGL